MFQNIHLLKWNLMQRGYSNKTVSRYFEEHQELDTAVDINANTDTSYMIMGNIEYLPIRPEIDSWFNHLAAISIFSLIEYRVSSYTERSGMDNYLLLYTYEGTGRLTYDGKEWILPPGCGAFIHCQNPHSYAPLDDNWKISGLHLKGELVKQIWTRFYQDQNPCFESKLSGGRYQEKLEKLLRTYQSAGANNDLYVVQDIDDLLSYLVENKNHAGKTSTALQETLSLLLLYIEQHYNEELTMEFLSDFSGISKYHLSREFKKSTGFSPYEYITNIRIQQAKNLLENTNAPLKEISMQVGYNDPNHFNHIFKLKSGITPGSYRKSTMADNHVLPDSIMSFESKA